MPPQKGKKIKKNDFWKLAIETSKKVEKWPKWKKDVKLEEYSYYAYTTIPKEKIRKIYKEKALSK